MTLKTQRSVKAHGSHPSCQPVAPVSPCVGFCRGEVAGLPKAPTKTDCEGFVGSNRKPPSNERTQKAHAFFTVEKRQDKAGGRKRPPAVHFAQQCWAFLHSPVRWSDWGFGTVKVVGIYDNAGKQRDLHGHLIGGRTRNGGFTMKNNKERTAVWPLSRNHGSSGRLDE